MEREEIGTETAVTEPVFPKGLFDKIYQEEEIKKVVSIREKEGRMILERFLCPPYSLKQGTKKLILKSFDDFVDNEELVHPFLILIGDCSSFLLKKRKRKKNKPPEEEKKEEETEEKIKDLSPREERKLKEKNIIKVARLLSIFSLRKNLSLEEKKNILFRLRVEFECSPIDPHPVLKDWGKK